MKFSCAKQNLLRAVSIAERFIGKNITLPILANILLEAHANNTLTVIATNLEYAVEVTVPGKTETSGRVSIPAKIISSLLQTTQDEKVNLEEKQQNLFLHTDSKNSRINGMNYEDFPLIPKIKKTNSFTINSFVLKGAIEQVASSASTSEFKPELTGLLFLLNQTTLKIVATDTFRLAEKTISLEKKISDSISFILPHRVSLELAKIIDEEEDITVSIGENQVIFEGDGVRILSRVIEGNFPDYTGVIPKQFNTSCFIKRDEITKAVRSSSIFASKIQETTLSFKNKYLEISSANSEVGEYKTKIPTEFTGKDLLVSFNYRYFLDGLSSLHEEEIFMGVNNEQAPSLFRSKNDNSYLYVLMPIRLS